MALTIAATLKDATGQPIQNGRLRITLGGYGAIIPRVAGSNIIASTAPVELQADASGVIAATAITGNDAITPAGTFYTVQVLDAKQNPVQANDYQFNGAAALDLSNLAPYNPPPQAVPVNPSGLSPVLVQTVITNPATLPATVGPIIIPGKSNIGAYLEITAIGTVNVTAAASVGELALRIGLAAGGTVGPVFDIAVGKAYAFTMKMRFPIIVAGYWSGEVIVTDLVTGVASVIKAFAGGGPYDFTSFTQIDVAATLPFTGSAVIDWLIPRVSWY